MNAHDSIVDGILQALRYPAPVCSGRIDEELDLDNIGEDEADAISVALERSSPVSELVNGPVDWRSFVTIECFARADSRQDMPTGGRASRRLHARVYERLMADATLGGRDISYFGQPELSVDSRPFATRAGVCTAVYEIGHRTQSATLEVTP